MDRNPIRTNIRRIRRLRRLGGGPHVCVLCRYSNPVGLVVANKRMRNFLVQHHFLGRNHDPDSVVLLCLNCHAEQHECMLQEGVGLSRETDPRARQLQEFRAMAVFFEGLSKTFRKWADEMEATDDSRLARTH